MSGGPVHLATVPLPGLGDTRADGQAAFASVSPQVTGRRLQEREHHPRAAEGHLSVPVGAGGRHSTDVHPGHVRSGWARALRGRGVGEAVPECSRGVGAILNVLGGTVRLLQNVPEGTGRLLRSVLEDCGAVVDVWRTRRRL